MSRPLLPAHSDAAWSDLRALTRARIAQGRSGNGQRSAELLAFGVDHALARDAVLLPLDVVALRAELAQAGFEQVLELHSAAPDRASYLMRPDLGRRLAAGQALAPLEGDIDLLPVLADGLSALGVQRYGVALLRALRERMGEELRLGPVVIGRQARVALGDEIGERLGARAVVMLIGERPGLSSPDSLGLYLTLGPRVGRSDAERNCISNVRADGLAPEEAARKLLWLLRAARRLGASGVALKDQSDAPPGLVRDAGSPSPNGGPPSVA
ncbi:ethanolamine ammonia-lyase subunit EutC [Roseateles sp. DAIF2]|uniref:ethanolamine ammonia-lyase subunit EutC n=1 Tax=Roseateles sp. DAIF2 TaxID=2714952 RepID=UPI0018A24FFE|nr:ethanolamine ammonia-lyase subunit EutC [Roseateles sp. DAIF2]QPF74627.1 ethanolamine ammonia-lyase subunit EutC [Roseateles sp. DAIF2]